MDITKIFYGPQDDLERKEGGSRAHYESTSYSPKNDKIKVIISRTSRYQSCKIESTFDAEGHDNYQLKIEDCKDK